MRALSLLMIVIFSSTGLAGVEIAADLGWELESDSGSRATISAEQKSHAVNDIVKRSKSAVSAAPTSLHALEANSLIILQGIDRVVVAGQFYVEREREEMTDVEFKPATMEFNYVTISSKIYTELDQAALELELQQIIGNLSFSTFMGSERYLGTLKVSENFNRDRSTQEIEEIYNEARALLDTQ